MRNLLSKIPAALLILSIAFSFGLGLKVWLNGYRARLLAQIQEQAGKNLNGTLSVSNLRFTPWKNGGGIIFSFDNVSLEDQKIELHHAPLLSAVCVSASLDIARLIHGEIRIHTLGVEDGKVRIFVGKDGYSNISLFEKIKLKEKPDSSGSQQNAFLGMIERFLFQNCPVQYTDSLRGKSYAGTLRKVTTRLTRSDSARHFELSGAILFDGLVFNADRGAFLRQQLAHTVLNFDYYVHQKLWRINSSSIKVADPKVGRIFFKGLINIQKKPGFLSLDFRVDHTSLPATLRLLPQKLENTILRRNILPDLKAEVHLEGPLNARNPLVTVEFNTGTFSYPVRYGQLLDLKAIGKFTNRAYPDQAPGDVNSRIEVSSVIGFFETIPLEGKLDIWDFTQPKSTMDFSMHASPATVNALLDTSRYVVKNGQADLNFHYEGSPITLYDSLEGKMNGKLKGTIQLRDIALSYLPGKITASQLNGDVSFDENKLLLPNLKMHDGRNTLYISGRVFDLPASLFGSTKPARAFVHVKIPDWQLSWPDKLLNRQKRMPAGNTKLKLSRLLDQTIDNLQISASLESEKMRYRRLEASNIRGSIIIKEHLIELNNLSMHTCGGDVKFSGGFQTNKNQKMPLFYADGELTKANVESVFYSFGNFGQNTLTHHNMKGLLTADFHFESLVKNDSSFVRPSMKGFVNINLDKARIVDFKPMMDIKKLLFKNRALENVQFAPLRTTFILKGEEVEVNKMKVESNILYFFLDGIYSFGNKTNLSIQIPMSNLRRKDPNSSLAIREVEDIKGDIIFLRARDEGGEVRIRYDKLMRYQ